MKLTEGGKHMKTMAPSSNFFALSNLLLLCQGIVTHAFLILPQYDFIIVGGGTAGCLLAARLSEILHWTVLLLEAGDEQTFIHDIPLVAPVSLLSTANWGFRAEKNNTFGLGLREGRLIFPRGKVMGGSSTINAMIYTRGNRKDFDNWETLGNTGWGYENVLPYFLKFEKMGISELENDTKYHSTKGELDINYPLYQTPLSTAFIAAGIENGSKYIDYNGEHQMGFSFCQTTSRGGARVSSYRAFLESVRTRRNLHIVKMSPVTRILIKPGNRKAYGVEYKLFGLIQRQACARKEVIISAGTINSPQLLMLSGIGPKKHLQELGIPVIQNSKVGYNLQDHVSLINLFFTVNASVDIHLMKPLKTAFNFLQYLLKREGEFTVPSGFEALSFIDVGKRDDFPEIEIFFGGLLLPSLPFYLSKFGVLSGSFNKVFEPLISMNGFTVFPILLRPFSTGWLKLKDKNPHSHPLIYPNYFSDYRDMEILIKGIREAVMLSKSKSFQKYGTDLYREPIPPCKNHDFGSDEYWECTVRHMTLSIQHAVGTCKMGPDSDPDAVVDTTLRVRGIKNLRVVDASIMPVITSGHTIAPVYMIAEKAADMIKSDWK